MKFINVLITWIKVQLQKSKVRKFQLSAVLNEIVSMKKNFIMSTNDLKDTNINFTQNIQNGEREVSIDLPFAKAKLIWNDNGKVLIYYTINIY